MISVTHLVLVSGKSLEECQKHVTKFFQTSAVLKYDNIAFGRQWSALADHEVFLEMLQSGVKKNRELLHSYLMDIKSTGISSLDQIPSIEDGYQSKLFHIIAHILDGFIDIDSFFYNLVDDSHWVRQELREKIEAKPLQYWLLELAGKTMDKKTASLIHE